MSSTESKSHLPQNKPVNILVMGVSGSGKSTIGLALAKAINAHFIDGDDLHPPANIAKMQSSQPLNDADRAPWLNEIALAYDNAAVHKTSLVIACSALKLSYRETLRASDSKLLTVFIDVNKDLLLKRMQARDHFMPPALLQSQLDTLENPTGEINTIVLSGTDEIENQIQQIINRILKTTSSL